MIRSKIAVAMLSLASSSYAAAAVPMEVALQAGAAKYSGAGQGECRFSEQGSIYGVQASQYSVSQSAGKQSLQLTLWQPKSGGAPMLGLHVSIDGKRYEVDTVKAGSKTQTKGSGQAKVQKGGAGAVFNIDAVTQGGEKITGTIKCAGFSPIQAEGG
jgi:hypothetical protein